MSALWEECRELLRARLGSAWATDVAPLRSWLDARILYLWVEREEGDYRSLRNPAAAHDDAIRRCLSEIAHERFQIHYLDRPPNRERIISERRAIEHRAKLSREARRERERLMEYAKDECRRLYRECGDARVRGTPDEKLRTVTAMVMDRAKARLEADRYRYFGRAEPPPDDPPG